MNRNNSSVFGSFRDPSGFVFEDNGKLLRQINQTFAKHFEKLLSSGLYRQLVERDQLIPHTDVKDFSLRKGAYKIIKPQKIKFLSYPYEWSFGQLQDAALLTLEIQKTALRFGMSLKDASAFNIQFENNQPILIDTLSFEAYQAGSPWIAYRQFCEHFLGPLSLMSYSDVRLAQLMKTYIHGIPLDFVSKLLPHKSYLNIGIVTHIHFHAKSQQSHMLQDGKRTATLSLNSLYGLIDNLYETTKNLTQRQSTSAWHNYYDVHSYSAESFSSKKKIVEKIVKQKNVNVVWDFGSNTGIFSQLVSPYVRQVIAFDHDYGVTHQNYLLQKKYHSSIFPLVMDITNPSSDMGWAQTERMGLLRRGKADLILALALLHHLVIGAGIPFAQVADYFSQVAKMLVIEFIPKEDLQVQQMLSHRSDVFNDYSETQFLKTFSHYFRFESQHKIAESKRVIYTFNSL
jgi:hypothetical protein